jgi:quercetin dioxygenase-like cupin family protein
MGLETAYVLKGTGWLWCEEEWWTTYSTLMSQCP